MATTTARRRLTELERAERVEALAAELAAAVQALTDSTAVDVQVVAIHCIPSCPASTARRGACSASI